jgi:predicted AAA+ superfamily ATPase
MNDIKAFVELYVQGQTYLFIDEFQYASQGGKHLKYIYDHFSSKTFIRGSSSTELSLQSIQYLVGRIFVFNLYPLTFSEFLRFKAPKLSQILGRQGSLSLEIIQKVNRYILILTHLCRFLLKNSRN